MALAAVVMIGGASASGKTEIAEEIVDMLTIQNRKAIVISMDHYYKRKQDREKVANPENMDIPDAFDLELFHKHLKQLIAGKAIARPTYSFLVKDRLPETETIDPNEVEVIVVEGILALHEVYKLKFENIITAYVESDNYLSYPKRRCLRDVNPETRNTSEEETRDRELHHYVRDAFFSGIATTKRYAKYQLTNNDPEPGKSKETCIAVNAALLMEAINSKLTNNNKEEEIVTYPASLTA
ncbi:uridine kinase family protein [Legionella micdadei]|uniref:Uridine kinase n=1 Tax=Legionella micdadei TaxID=451 RepID=A0A098GD33_LEGMI|nr:zeta toxin family protein [Legionella micdadei]ARG98398.1 hypothetical protein B6N58_12435 [Legionella micdadei]ARH01148.1 hypothetical protein B6V88_12440 [Legionella micdadei]KTD30396.1 uridine kinase [Legionella micdadei]NSL18329.1 zeta toxin family protein [Legionella micdadei]CEG59920.1 putative Uridine kinase [Legionella micdadei]